MLGSTIAAAPIASASLRVLATEAVGPRSGGIAPSEAVEAELRRVRVAAEPSAGPTRP